MEAPTNPWLSMKARGWALSEASNQIQILINRLVVGHNVPGDKAASVSAELCNVISSMERVYARLARYDSDGREEAGKTTAPRVGETDSGIGAAQT